MTDDRRNIEFFRQHPAAMAAFDRLAAEHGQDIQASYLPELNEEFGIPRETALIRWPNGEPLAAIAPDGSLRWREEGQNGATGPL